MRLCRLCKKLFSDERATCPDHASVLRPSVLPISGVSVEPLPVELAARFPQYEPFALGSSGTLYLNSESSTVLKVLHASLTRDAAERARYWRELRRQQNLLHPQLPHVRDVGEAGERLWLTRDFVEGKSLAVRLLEGEPFDLAAAYSVIVQLAAALDVLHQLGVVHRDLKPAHVLLRANKSARESVQLIDAGVAGPLTPDDASRHGTPEYAAKELVEGAPATFRSDLYALGCLSYELLAGAPPFRDATRNAAEPTVAMLKAHREAEPAELPERVPEAVRSLITSMLAKDAHRRPFSAQQVRRALEPQIAAANAAARRASSLNDTQPRAATLRFTVPDAKPVSPARFPDATVELDVEDLDEAIQVNDDTGAADARSPKQDNGASRDHAAASERTGVDVDDTTPTIALSNTRAIMSSMLPGANKSLMAAKTDADAPTTAVSTHSAESAARGPTHAPTGTKFGLGPVRAQDIAAASALAAELKSAPLSDADSVAADAVSGSEAAPAAQRLAKPAPRPSARRKRYTSTAKPLLQDPRLLLWAAGGLVVLILLLRVVLGASPPSRSAAVVVQVPETSNDELAQLDAHAREQLEQQLSEAALIGGDIARPAQPTAAERRRAARTSSSDQLTQSDGSQPTAAGADHSEQPAAASARAHGVAAVAPAPIVEASADRTDAKKVPTVTAGSVRGGLARATSNRQAAASGTNVSAVNSSNSPDSDFKAKGRVLFKAGKYNEAIDAYQRATKRDSSDAQAFAGLGGSLLAKGDTRRAISAYQRAVNLQPKVSGFQAALGRAYLQKGDRVRAQAAYSKALSLDPNNQAARNGIANAKAR